MYNKASQVPQFFVLWINAKKLLACSLWYAIISLEVFCDAKMYKIYFQPLEVLRVLLLMP